MSEKGDKLREAASLIDEVADNAPEWDGDEETLMEYEEEFGEVPSYQNILYDMVNTTRQLALMVDVEEEE